MISRDFIHPADAKALNVLRNIPGFPALVKKVMELGLEQLKYGVNMASTIRLSPTQLPHLYNRLPPICRKLGMKEPEFYLKMDPQPNAFTFGDTRVYITITSGLVELLSEEELDAVIAHECGHILCQHVLYHSVASYILSGADKLGLIDALTVPLQYALLYWARQSELSCDRVGAIITSPEVVASSMARLSGGPRSITRNLDMEAWARQADEYEKISNDGLWNKALQLSVVLGCDHPFSAVRVREILNWGKTQQYYDIKHGTQQIAPPVKLCHKCGKQVDSQWGFCKYCGSKLY